MLIVLPEKGLLKMGSQVLLLLHCRPCRIALITLQCLIGIVSGKYEDEICTILEENRGCNVFLYVDPYGIKALDCTLFDCFATHGFNSIELLINMNSFGFIREGCRVLGVNFDDNDIFEDLVEYDSTHLVADENSKLALNKIAGGDYWIRIIEAKRRNKICR